MMNSATAIYYPATPKNIDARIIEPSAAFRQEVVKVLLAILFFIFTYFLLISAAVLLAVLCGYGGIMLIAIFPKFFTLMIGLGMIGLGGMVIYFLLKFIFKTYRVDRANLLEVTAKDQPVLFDFIRTLTRETQTPFPKRIYVSPDVNASVFYDSAVWSTFLPIRKNLQIGLGLVNSVNVSEFKAILAHEFGHFSQKSMKLGSYVYNVNRVIYNMLYDNEGYGRTLESWANVSAYFAFFANLTVSIVKGIQWLLQRVYAIINKRYLALSRQMEFHADSVAAYVSGSAPLITSLRRLDVANICYHRVLDYYNIWYKENQKADNLYQHHAEVMKHFAESHGLKSENGVIQVTAHSLSQYKARVMIKDQWASHPSTDDREKYLDQLNIQADLVVESAWILFTNVEDLQQELTDHVYSGVHFETTPQWMNLKAFRERYYADIDKYSLDKRYKGFYDARNLTVVDVDSLTTEQAMANNLDEILTEQTLELPNLISALEIDIQTLQGIQRASAATKTFEFNGEKYSKEEAPELCEELTLELADSKADLVQADKSIMMLFFKIAASPERQRALREEYKNLFAVMESTGKEVMKLNDVLDEVSQLYGPKISVDSAYAVTNNLKREELSIKARIKEMLGISEFTSLFSAPERARLELYIGMQREYFVSQNFNTEALILFHDAMNIYKAVLSDRMFVLKKQLLAGQLALT